MSDGERGMPALRELRRAAVKLVRRHAWDTFEGCVILLAFVGVLGACFGAMILMYKATR